MNPYSSLPYLLKKEFLSITRNKGVVYAYLLYILGVSFISFIGFMGSGGIHPRTWNTLYWISTLFCIMHICYKTFNKEGTFYYYYTITSPESYLLSKIIFNCFIAFLVNFSNFLFYSLFLGYPVQSFTLFVLSIFIGTICLSTTFTLVNAIADKSTEKSIMVPILSFPTSLPCLILSVKLAKNAVDGIAFSESIDEIIILSGLFLIIFAISILLYPFIWRS